MRDEATKRGVEPGDVLFVLFLVAYAALSFSLIPFDFQDLCYLFSLEQGRWVMQEWVHPLYVPVLDLLQHGLALIGYEEPMLVPVEVLNVAAAIVAFALLYRLARRFPGSSLAAAVALSVAALSYGFWLATVRPTPYALAFLSQTISLLLLISDHPVALSRYALAGALAGVSMGFHASAMALGVVGVVAALCESERSVRARGARIGAFAGAMLASAIACWVVFVRYRAIGVDFFRSQDFRSSFLAIEQMPGSSIYTSGSAIEQLSTFSATLRWQASGLLPATIIVGLIAALRRWRSGEPPTPLERSLAIVTAANFVAIAGFFLINNTHNGFIFASLTLMPVALAVAVRDSRVLLALLVLVALPDSVRNVIEMRTGPMGRNEPLLVEARYLQQMLGPRDVLVTPGTPFPEVLYLAHLNVFELSQDGASHPSPEVPVVQAGPELRARIAWWRAQGGRVFYALGDEAADFTGDVSGAAKERQVFWRPETTAAARVPRLQASRAALTGAGIELRDPISSPNGQRYAELIPSGAAPLPPPAPAAALRPQELRTLFLHDQTDVAAAYRAHRAQYLARLAAALPGDPWHDCDVMQLICQGRPRRAGHDVPCEQSARCAALSGYAAGPRSQQEPRAAESGANQECFWGKLSTEAEEQAVSAYLARWVAAHDLGHLVDWGFRATQQSAEMSLAFSDGALQLSWRLSSSCTPGVVTMSSSRTRQASVTEEALRQLVADLPIPKVRAGVAPPGRPERL